MTNLFADVSSYQPTDLTYIKNLGAKGVVVKLTQGSQDGDNYVNPRAAGQIRSALSLNLQISLYHYCKFVNQGDAINEANFFAKTANNYGLGKNTLMVADVEDPSISNLNNRVNTTAFLEQLKKLGYQNVALYSMASWFWSKKLPTNYPIWVANYGVSAPGVNNSAAWQFTSQYNGLSLDMSYDFSGIFTNSAAQPQKKQNPNVITVAVDGFNSVWADAFQRPSSKFKSGSQWLSFGICVIDGNTYYAVAKDEYFPQRATEQAGICTINYVDGYGVNAIDQHGKQISGSNQKFKTGTKWKANVVQLANKQWVYEVATNCYIPFEFTNGSGKKY